MDKVKLALALLKKHHFWVMTGTVILLSSIGWFLATSSLLAQYQSGRDKILKKFGDLGQINAEERENQDWVDGLEKETQQLKVKVGLAWEKVYTKQKVEVLKWPIVLGSKNVAKLKELGPNDVIPRDIRDRYLNYIQNEFPRLLEIVDAKDYRLRKTGPAGKKPPGKVAEAAGARLQGDLGIEESRGDQQAARLENQTQFAGGARCSRRPLGLSGIADHHQQSERPGDGQLQRQGQGDREPVDRQRSHRQVPGGHVRGSHRNAGQWPDNGQCGRIRFLVGGPLRRGQGDALAGCRGRGSRGRRPCRRGSPRRRRQRGFGAQADAGRDAAGHGSTGDFATARRMCQFTAAGGSATVSRPLKTRRRDGGSTGGPGCVPGGEKDQGSYDVVVEVAGIIYIFNPPDHAKLGDLPAAGANGAQPAAALPPADASGGKPDAAATPPAGDAGSAPAEGLRRPTVRASPTAPASPADGEKAEEMKDETPESK